MTKLSAEEINLVEQNLWIEALYAFRCRTGGTVVEFFAAVNA